MKILEKIFAYLFILPVKIYQWVISPLFPPSCRHIPTCSNYTIKALKTHGIIKGLWLSTNRIIRCNPHGTEGYDPVPPKMNKQEWQTYKKITKMGYNPDNQAYKTAIKYLKNSEDA